MRRFFVLASLAVLFAPGVVAADEALRTQVALDLKRFYEERLRQPIIARDDAEVVKVGPPPWVEPIKQLSAAKPEDRRHAADYLRELVSQAADDEYAKTAPWRALPFWGGGSEVPARDLRESVANELGKAGPLPDGLPVLRWYLENERIDKFLEPVMAALSKLDGAEADLLRTRLASQPHENAMVAAEAIGQLAAHKRSLPAERLMALCHHHRAAIREAARILNAQQGGKDPGPFDAAKAVRSEPLRTLMDQVLVLMPDLPPANAEFVEVTVRYLDAKKTVRQHYEVRGWLTRREGDQVEIYTPFGEPETLRNGEQQRVQLSEPLPDGRGRTFFEADITVDVSVAPRKMEEQVKEVEASRAKNTAGQDLSEGGPLTGQFRGSGATLYEAILGTWLYRAGRDAEAARVLLPALDSLYADRHFVAMVRRQLGEFEGYRMLVAFAGDRDYEQALRHARLIDRLYPDSRFHEYAQGLAEQLPKRGDDFTKLKLPTPAEWAEFKKKLTRTEQIDFLCQRYRLLNYFQSGQPGGYYPGSTQYAEPCGMASNASWGLGKGKTKVINPEVELAGISRRDDDKPRGLNLTLRDVPQLSKHLRDDWLIPTVTFWRDFHPDRNVGSTRPLLAGVINNIAKRDICKIDTWDKLTPAEIDKEIDRIQRWALTNADKTEAQLRWQALEDSLAAGEDWSGEMSARVEWFLTKKDSRAYDVMRRMLEGNETDAYGKSEILGMYLEHDPTLVKDLAPKYLDHKSGDVRLVAALIVHQTGDKSKSRPILGESLAKDEVNGRSKQIVELLLKDGSPELREQVARLFGNKELPRGGRLGSDDQTRGEILKLCADAGMKEPYAYYLKQLDNTEVAFSSFPTDSAEQIETTYAEVHAKEIVTELAPNDPAIQEIVKHHKKETEQIPDLKEWLQAKTAAGFGKVPPPPEPNSN